MTGPTHVLFGVTTGVVLCKTLGMEIDPIAFLCLIVGSLGPDIDADNGTISKPGKLFQGFLPRGLARVLDELGTVLSRLARLFTGHRGFFHTPILGIAMLAIAWFLTAPRFEWFAIGYLSHILADACTVRGVPALWPLRSAEYSLMPVRVGSSLEALIALGLCIFVSTVGWALLPQRTQQGFIDLRQAIIDRQEKSERAKSDKN